MAKDGFLKCRELCSDRNKKCWYYFFILLLWNDTKDEFCSLFFPFFFLRHLNSDNIYLFYWKINILCSVVSLKPKFPSQHFSLLLCKEKKKKTVHCYMRIKPFVVRNCISFFSQPLLILLLGETSNGRWSWWWWHWVVQIISLKGGKNKSFRFFHSKD